MIIRLPMCPTSNHMYTSVNGRLIKSAEARKYNEKIKFIKMKLFRQLDEFVKTLSKDPILKVDTYFVFPKKKYFCKDGSLRKYDSFNRQKISMDSLSILLGIDDSKFIDGRIMKTYWDKDEEVIYFKITELTSPIAFDELTI